MANENENKRYQVNHYHSLDKTANGEAVAPAAAELGESEMALNLAKGVETLYVKNGEGEVIATPLGTRGYAALQKQLEEIAQIYSIYGMARVNDDTDPKGTIFFGEDVNFKQIANVVHLGLVDKDGKLYKRCANGRVDKAVDGVDLAIDGSDGDVLLYIDRTVYVCRFTDEVEHEGAMKKLNVFAVGLAPFSIYGHTAKVFKPFAFSPQYTVNGQLTASNNGKDGNGVVDLRSCAHSIYNKNVAGSYSVVLPWFNETYKANGGGFPAQYVSSMNSIWQAQGKNPDQKTNRPFMGGYYEFTEIILMLMFLENKTLYHQALNDFGCGCTLSSPATSQDSFGDLTMNGNSGLMCVKSDGTKTFLRLMSTSTIKNGTSQSTHPIDGVCGDGHYGFTEMLETQRVLNDIAKAGLISKIWNGTTANADNQKIVFEYDADGNMIVSSFTNEELKTGANMTPNKKYFQVRNANTKCQGMADGVMTAVVNTYVKLTFKNETTVNEVDHTGGYAVYKFSRPVYRGMSLHMEGMFVQMQGCHYVNYCYSGKEGIEDGDYGKFICAESFENIPPQQSASVGYFGDVDALLDMEKGLTKEVQSHGKLTRAQKRSYNGWAGKDDYNMSLFCILDHSGSITTKECQYHWNYASWSNGDAGADNYGLPAANRKCVNAVVVGCYAGNGNASARSVAGNYAVSYGVDSYAGRFSLPHLTF